MKARALLATLALALPLPSTPAAAQEPGDAAIAHIAVTANQLDVAAARQALARSNHPEVRRFAETMIRDHEGVIAQASDLASRLGVTPEDNATSQALTAQAQEVRDRLAHLQGASFDRAYMEHEVAYHETVIAAVRETLIPNTSNGELRSLLQAVLPALEAHLDHARSLHAELAGR